MNLSITCYCYYFKTRGRLRYWDLTFALSYLIYREIKVEVQLRESLGVRNITEKKFFQEIKTKQTRWPPPTHQFRCINSLKMKLTQWLWSFRSFMEMIKKILSTSNKWFKDLKTQLTPWDWPTMQSCSSCPLGRYGILWRICTGWDGRWRAETTGSGFSRPSIRSIYPELGKGDNLIKGSTASRAISQAREDKESNLEAPIIKATRTATRTVTTGNTATVLQCSRSPAGRLSEKEDYWSTPGGQKQ